MEIKTIAFYLPQFHRIPENDMWWGPGYTEWNAVKNARPLFDGHYQPHEPFEDNYYDLLDKKAMQWQAGLMGKYHVDGLCFYHYYFKDGKQVLEKPAENLLQWKDISIPFCFAWANESWKRTWSKLGGNSWNDICNSSVNDTKNNGILLSQEYGNEEDWEKHIYYLIPFFKDERYIKKNGHPVFIIYKLEDIKCFGAMIKCWNSILDKEGIKSLYCIGSNHSNEHVQALISHQPAFSGLGSFGRIMDYSTACERIVDDAIRASNESFLCSIVSYDDTPRRGANGFVLKDATPEAFYDLMKKLYFLSDKTGKEFVFVNAWNEWGEGMHLEPDKRFGYGFLEALKRAKEDYKDMTDFSWLIDRLGKLDFGSKATEEDAKKVSKYKSHYYLLNKWMIIKEENKSLAPFFKDKNIKAVAIYGMGILGKHLLEELESIDIEVKYGIDRSIKQHEKLEMRENAQGLSFIDAIIVTPVDEFYEIKNKLKNETEVTIVSLEDVVNYCL